MGVTRSKLAGALRDHYGIDPNKDSALVGSLWDRYRNDCNNLDDPDKQLEDIIGLAEPIISAVQEDRQRRSPAYGEEPVEIESEEVQQVDFTHALSSTGDLVDGETSVHSKKREWIGHRVSAFSEYLTKILAVDEGVIRFRKRVLGSPTATLTPEQAERLIHSPAARILPFAFFEKHGISLIDHTAITESYEKIVSDGGDFHHTTVYIEPAGIRETVRSLKLSQDALETLYWPGLDNEEFALHVRVWAGSVLWELQRLGKWLSDKHPWQQDQAVYFVLTGVPQLAATLRFKTRRSIGKGVKAHKYSSATIVIEAEHWVPVDEVARAYRKAQREAHEGSKNRKPADRNIAVFRHVVSLSYVRVKSIEENLARIEIPKWRDMLRSWNKDHPPGDKWHYEDEEGKGVKRFHRDFKRGQHAVVGSDFGLPGDPNQPMTRAEFEAWYARFMERGGAKSTPS